MKVIRTVYIERLTLLLLFTHDVKMKDMIKREERWWAWQEMDPGRYALHQGWDNNSVIVVSSLNNSPIWNIWGSLFKETTTVRVSISLIFNRRILKES